jgi:VanZ family protein
VSFIDRPLPLETVCDPPTSRALYSALIIIVALIVYGSLYPWDFIFADANPWVMLRTSWHAAVTEDFPTVDFVVNVVLYVPLGLCGYLAIQRGRQRRKAVASAVALGVCVSTGIEILQAYGPFRYCSVVDILANGLGSMVGAVAGILTSKWLLLIARRCRFAADPDVAAFSLLFCWAGYMLFPLFPVTSRMTLRDNAIAFFMTPFESRTFASAMVVWLAGGSLLKEAAVPYAHLSLWFSTVLIPMQLFIVTRQSSLVEFLGAITGCSMFVLLPERIRRVVTPVALLMLIISLGVTPAETLHAANSFHWIPFGSLLAGDNDQRSLTTLIEKMFFYGTTIWSLRFAGVRVKIATCIVVVTLAGVEVIQLYMPGRTPDVTDPLLAVLLGLACHMLTGLHRQNLIEKSL